MPSSSKIFLDAQHFLDLVADQEFVLEDQQDVLAQLDAAQLFLRHDVCSRMARRAPWHRLQGSSTSRG
jgi:hypothetical protein